MSDARVEPAPAPAESRASVSVCLALFFGTLLLFSRAIQHDFLDLDDPDYVTRNLQVQAGLTAANIPWAFTTGDAGNWHPLTWLSHMLDWQLFGNHPAGHHAMNVFWHALNAVLAFLALRRLTGAFWTSAVTAALFAWHPLRVESVAWIAERKDVLSTCFGLLTLWMYGRYANSAWRQAAGVRNSASRDYALTLLFFALGLMCKPMLVTLPFLLLLLDLWPLGRLKFSSGATGFALLLEKIPFLLLSAASCAITYLCQKKSGAVVETLALNNRLSNALVATTAYLGKFFWPFKLAIGYPRPAGWPVTEIVGSAILLSVITAAILWQWRRRPWLTIGWLWFLGALVPVIGLVPVGLQAMADRYTYLPTLGLSLALMWAVRESKLFLSPRWFAAAAAVLLASCAARTWGQLAFWQNSRVLYEHALAVTDANYLAHCYLGTTLFNEDRVGEASLHFRRAIELKPDYAAANLRLGLALEKTDHDHEALAVYEKFLEFKPDDPDAQFHCANVLARLNRDAEALSHYESAIRLKPDFEPAQCNYADSLRALNHPAEAAAHYRTALALRSDDANAHYGLGAALEDSDRADEALASYRRAVEIKPQFADAQYSVGALLLNRDQPAEALAHFQSAIKIKTNFAAAYLGLGLTEAQLNQTHAAIRDLERAQQLEPGAAGVSETLMQLRGKLAARQDGVEP